MLETVVTMGGMSANQLPDSPARRISLRLWQLGLKKKDVAAALGYSPSFISEVSNGNREFSWNDTAKLAGLLQTTTDYLLCRTDDPELPTTTEPAPYYQHEESDTLAKLADAQPQWLRAQILAVAKAQVEAVREGTAGTDPTEQLRQAVRVAASVLGPDEFDRLANETRRRNPNGLSAANTVGSYRQFALGQL
jgi:transcriptional regulator with XRE-family HTH domain